MENKILDKSEGGKKRTNMSAKQVGGVGPGYISRRIVFCVCEFA